MKHFDNVNNFSGLCNRNNILGKKKIVKKRKKTLDKAGKAGYIGNKGNNIEFKNINENGRSGGFKIMIIILLIDFIKNNLLKNTNSLKKKSKYKIFQNVDF